MQWVKAFHIIFMVTWFAGLFYLPRLFVYHAMTQDEISSQRFKIMERKLYYGIMTPGGILTIIFGYWLVAYDPGNYFHSIWFHLKLICVFLLVVFHLYCGKLYQAFKQDKNKYNHVFYRWLNEIPTILLITIIILAFIQPFGKI